MSRLDILTKNNKNYEIREVSYKSEFDFEKYDILDESIKEKIEEVEIEVIEIGTQIARKSLELGKKLYESQQILSQYKTGSFVAWYTYLGLEKNMVYREINRWELFLKYKNSQIIDASIRTLDFIKKNENDITEEQILEILEEPKLASEKIKLMQQEEKELEAKNIEDELEKIDNQIEKLKEKIQKLEEKRERIREENL